jgi:hypothetical protein
MARVASLERSTVSVQLTDRVPQLSLPKQDDQAIEQRIAEVVKSVVTAVRRPSIE